MLTIFVFSSTSSDSIPRINHHDKLAVNKLKKSTPTIISRIPSILPPNDIGIVSPYPTVVIVLITYQTASNGVLISSVGELSNTRIAMECNNYD